MIITFVNVWLKDNGHWPCLHGTEPAAAHRLPISRNVHFMSLKFSLKKDPSLFSSETFVELQLEMIVDRSH
jgi:hypothetical protein